MRGISWLALLSAAAMLAPAHAQSYPTRAIRLIVHSSPGGSSDILGRLIAQRLSESLGQQVVVENRAGATGTIAARPRPTRSRDASTSSKVELIELATDKSVAEPVARFFNRRRRKGSGR